LAVPRAITTLQSNQLRGLVGASLEEYLTFFRRHPAVAQVDPQQDQLTWNVPPVFELELVLQPGACTKDGERGAHLLYAMSWHAAA
jgi:hypothetical protein